MYTLFYSPGACSMAVHALLHEVGAKFEVKKAADHAEEFAKANPRKQVPTLIVDGKPLVEGAAILTYICENEKSTLLPAEGWERAQAQQWLAWANSSLHPKYGALFGLMKNEPAEIKNGSVYTRIEGMIAKSWDEVEAELQSKDYICGKDITVADLLIAVIANWTPKVTSKVSFGPKTKAYLKRVTSRPSFQKALEMEHVEYKAAA